MALRIPVGKEDFEEIRRGNSYYVDKTELIYDLVNGTDNKVTLFTRPRRFGKTLMMSMLRSFFDINRDSRDVFTGLSIMSHPEFCQEWMNRYPVLFLTLKGVEDLTFEEAFATLKVKLSELFAEHAVAGKLRTSEKFRHIVIVDGDHMVLDYVTRIIKPKPRHLRENSALIRDLVLENMVKSRDPVRCYHDERLACVIDLAYFSFLYRLHICLTHPKISFLSKRSCHAYFSMTLSLIAALSPTSTTSG